MNKLHFLDIGYNEDTILYEIQLKEIWRANGVTADYIDQVMDDYGVRQVVIDAGEPRAIDRFRAKRIIKKLFRRKINA